MEEILRSALPGSAPSVDSGRSHGLARRASADLEIAGITIPAGDLVLLGLQQANNAAELVGDRSGFDITRHPDPLLSFGYGPRFCLGAPLARPELQVLLAALLGRLPGLALAVPAAALRPRTELLTGGLATLPVTW